MNEFYIGVINRIIEDDRISFSMIIDMPELSDEETKILKGNITIKREEAEANPIIDSWFSQIQTKGYWNEWMQDWTSATIYQMYRGEESFNV
jgi:hypothetical protein